jgi:hypothetical protein
MTMDNIIKYKRKRFHGDDRELQVFFDKLIEDGFTLFSYQELEVNCSVPENKFNAIIIYYKQNNIKNILND